MITKTGRKLRGLQKKASIFHAILGPAVHVGQNMFMRGLMENPSEMRRKFVEDIVKTVATGRTHTGNVLDAVKGGFRAGSVIDPQIMRREMTEIHEKMLSYIRKFHEAKNSLGEFATGLGQRKHSILFGKVLRGDFDSLARTRHGEQYIKAFLGSFHEDLPKVYDYLDPMQKTELLSAMKRPFAETPMVRGVVDELRGMMTKGKNGRRRILDVLDEAKKKSNTAAAVAGNASDAVTQYGMYLADPIAAGIGLGKTVLTHPSVAKGARALEEHGERIGGTIGDVMAIPNHALEFAKKKMIDSPNRAALEKGLDVGATPDTLGSLAGEIGGQMWSYSAQQLKQLYRNLGNSLHNIGIDRDTLGGVSFCHSVGDHEQAKRMLQESFSKAREKRLGPVIENVKTKAQERLSDMKEQGTKAVVDAGRKIGTKVIEPARSAVQNAKNNMKSRINAVRDRLRGGDGRNGSVPAVVQAAPSAPVPRRLEDMGLEFQAFSGAQQLRGMVR